MKSAEATVSIPMVDEVMAIIDNISYEVDAIKGYCISLRAKVDVIPSATVPPSEDVKQLMYLSDSIHLAAVRAFSYASQFQMIRESAIEHD